MVTWCKIFFESVVFYNFFYINILKYYFNVFLNKKN
jgi:hypothetical protein